MCRPCAGSGIKILRDIPQDGPVLIKKGEVMTVAALEAWRQPPHSLELVLGTDYKLKGGAVGGGAGVRARVGRGGRAARQWGRPGTAGRRVGLPKTGRRYRSALRWLSG